MKEHKYTPYRPSWCKHPPFESIDYCWGLACAVDANELSEFLSNKCNTCDLSKFYKRKKTK